MTTTTVINEVDVSYYMPMLKAEAIKLTKGQIIHDVKNTYNTVEDFEQWLTVKLKIRVPTIIVIAIKLGSRITYITKGEFIEIV